MYHFRQDMLLIGLIMLAPVVHAQAGITQSGTESSTTSTAASPASITHSTDSLQGRSRSSSKKSHTGKYGVQTLSSVVVTSQAVSFTNNVLPPVMLKFQAPLSSVVDAVNVLPGVNVTPGGVFDSDVWSFGITLRGFTQNQLGFTIDGLPNGATDYSGGTLPNRYLDPENLRRITVSQGTADISSPSDQALGGTLNYYSNDPSMKRHLRIDYSTGSWNAQREFVRYDTGALFNGNTYGYISFSNTFNKRWMGTGTNGHTSRVHMDSKLISYLSDNLTMTAIASFDHAYENNYNSVTLAQFQQDPNWDHLTWNWTGKPYVDQNFVEPWNTVRTNVLAGVKFEYIPNENSRYSFYPYYHFQEGTGGWLPPYQLYAANGSGTLTGGYPVPGGGSARCFGMMPTVIRYRGRVDAPILSMPAAIRPGQFRLVASVRAPTRTTA